MTTITESEAAALIADMLQLESEIDTRRKDAGEFTTIDYATANHIDYDDAYDHLTRALKAGKVSVRKISNRLYYSFIKLPTSGT